MSTAQNLAAIGQEWVEVAVRQPSRTNGDDCWRWHLAASEVGALQHARDVLGTHTTAHKHRADGSVVLLACKLPPRRWA